MVVIFNERLHGNPRFIANCVFLQGNEVKMAPKTSPFDLCFNVVGQPSIFIALFGMREGMDKIIARLTRLQNMSKFSFGLGALHDDAAWATLNNSLPRGTLRLLRTTGDSNVVFPTIITMIVKELSNIQKLDLQKCVHPPISQPVRTQNSPVLPH